MTSPLSEIESPEVSSSETRIVSQFDEIEDSKDPIVEFGRDLKHWSQELQYRFTFRNVWFEIGETVEALAQRAVARRAIESHLSSTYPEFSPEGALADGEMYEFSLDDMEEVIDKNSKDLDKAVRANGTGDLQETARLIAEQQAIDKRIAEDDFYRVKGEVDKRVAEIEVERLRESISAMSTNIGEHLTH